MPIYNKVVRVIAKEKRVPPGELRPPIRDVVDPDALDDLFQNGTGRVTFEYADHEVVLNHSGDVEVTPLSQPESR